MTLIITALAAIAATVSRFVLREKSSKVHLGFLALMYCGASIMWCVDGFFCLAEGEPFIELSDAATMTDDALLGLSVVVLGLVVWGIVCIIKRGTSQKTAAA